MTWVILVLYAGLVVIAFFIANSESSKAKDAAEIAKLAMSKIEVLERQVLLLRDQRERDSQALKEFVSAVLSNDSDKAKLKEKLEWLEMKVGNLPKSQVIPSKISLTQDKPIQITLIQRKGPPVKLLPVKKQQTDRASLIKEVGKKLNDLSQ